MPSLCIGMDEFIKDAREELAREQAQAKQHSNNVSEQDKQGNNKDKQTHQMTKSEPTR